MSGLDLTLNSATQTELGPLQERSQISDGDFPVVEDDEEAIAFSPGREECERADSTSRVSPIDTSPLIGRPSISIGGLDLDMSDERKTDDAKNAPKKIKRTTRRRKRKVVVDNENTELSSEHIKHMLRDTTDIVQQNRMHPADYVTENDDVIDPFLHRRKRIKKTHRSQVISELPYNRLFQRPCCADDGELHSHLLQVFLLNTARLRGEPLPFRLRGQAGQQQRLEVAESVMKATAAQEAEEEEEVELARKDEAASFDRKGRHSIEFPNRDQKEDEPEFPQHDEEDEDFAIPFDEEDVHLATQQQDGSFADDMDDMRSPASERSEFSLGAVNDMEADLDDVPRQEQGEEMANSGSKWHKHTVKVFEMLKRNIAEVEDDKEGPHVLSFDKLSKGTSRRTACGVFFELLQLKTWSFIELNQDKAYGDINIMRGARFNENPPSDQ